MLVECQECGRATNKLPNQIKKTKRNFCSRSCAAKYNNRLHPKRQMQGECKVCNIPVRKSATYCKECAETKPWVKVNAERHPKTARNCRHCNKEFLAVKGIQCPACVTNRRRFKIKEDAIQYKGGCCFICKYNRCKRSLTFHHVNEKEKSFSISGGHCYSKEKIQKELDKCVLLCHNCHMEVHDGMHSELGLIEI